MNKIDKNQHPYTLHALINFQLIYIILCYAMRWNVDQKAFL